MIPEEINDEVEKITNEIIKYRNTKKLSWTGAYKDILQKLNLTEKNSDPKLLMYVVKKISYLGYDIVPEPFKLERYR